MGKKESASCFFELALPAIISQFVNVLYNIVDRIFIGHIPGIGPDALTGVGVTFPIIMVVSAFSVLIGMGGAPRAAIKMGQNKYDEAEHIMGNCFVALIALSVILTVAFMISGSKLLVLLGASPKTLPYALCFLRVYLCGTVFVQITIGMNPFITTQGFAKISMFTVLIGAVINIILDPIFIFALHMGVQGAAFANVLSQSVSAIWIMQFLFGKKTKLRIRKKYMKIRKNIIVPVLLLGISPFVMQSTESLLNIAFNSSLQTYGGDIAVGSMTLLSSLMQVLNLMLMGMTQGAQPIISYNFGAKNNTRIRKTFRLLLTCALCYSLLFWALVMLFPYAAASIFSGDVTLLKATAWSMRIYFAVAFLLAIQTACQQTFIAVGQVKCSLFLALLRKIVLLIPLIYILPCFFSDKVFAVFLAEPISDVLSIATTAVLFACQFNKILLKNVALQEDKQASDIHICDAAV